MYLADRETLLHRMNQGLVDYIELVLRELAGHGVVGTDPEGRPRARVTSMRVERGSWQVDLEVDLGPLHLGDAERLHVRFDPTQRPLGLDWSVPRVHLARTLAEWSPAEAAAVLGPSCLRGGIEQSRRYRGNPTTH
jgi:hypothetical protein